jgi:arsenate reductase (glutaredoxin)
MNITIYHNPSCSKSRKTLELISSQGITPTIVEYLANPPMADTLLGIAKLLGIPIAGLLRRNEDAFRDAGDAVPLEDDQALAAWIHDNPLVLQRPIVVDVANGRAVLGRPPEKVFELLKP